MTAEQLGDIKKIADWNGLEHALDKLAEECAEYAAARMKCNIGEGAGEDMLELADVLIMAKQVEYLMNLDSVKRDFLNKEVSLKLDRQIKRMEEENAGRVKG